MGCCESRLGKKPFTYVKESELPIDSILTNDYRYNSKNDYQKPRLVIEEIPKNKLSIIKKLNNCHNSEVYLLSGNIILKKYPDTIRGKGHFNNEIEAYRIMKGCHFILDIISKDVIDRSFILPYIPGDHIKSKHSIALVKKYLEIMNAVFGFERIKPISWKNVLVRNEDVYLIDFGSLPIIYNVSEKQKWKVHKRK